jgi:cytochrome c553
MRRPFVVSLLAAAALPLLLAGCGEEAGTGPDMRPGENCLACHGFSAAGTVFEPSGAGAGGVTVEFITGANTLRASVVTSGSGNFHTNASLPAGFNIRLTRGAATPKVMSAPPSGACNTCHAAGGTGHILAP